MESNRKERQKRGVQTRARIHPHAAPLTPLRAVASSFLVVSLPLASHTPHSGDIRTVYRNASRSYVVGYPPACRAVPFRFFFPRPHFFSLSVSLIWLSLRYIPQPPGPGLSCDPSRSSAIHAAAESDTHESSRIHINTHLPSFLPACSGPASFVSLSPPRRFPIVSLHRIGVLARIRLSPLHPQARYAPATVHSAGYLRSASLVSARRSVRVCHRLSALLPPSRPVVFTHTRIRRPLSPLSLSPHFTCGSVFLSSLLLLSESDGEGNVSPAVSRLSPPHAVGCFFSPLCPCILPRRESAAAASFATLSCLVNRDIPSYASRKARKLLASKARERVCSETFVHEVNCLAEACSGTSGVTESQPPKMNLGFSSSLLLLCRTRSVL